MKKVGHYKIFSLNIKSTRELIIKETEKQY